MVFTVVFSKDNKLIGTKEIPISFEVTSEVIGFNLEGETLNFGKIPLGGQASRSLVINNDKNERILIRLYFSNSVKKYISGDYEFSLLPLETQNISLSVNIPEDSILGIVNGTVNIVSFLI
jgi:hypothetical protein